MAAPAPAPLPPENSPVISATSDLERRVMATVMASETRGEPPWLCAVKVGQYCDSGESPLSLGNRIGLPNAEVASILVSNLCFSHNTPFTWKLLEQAMATKLVYPLHVLALLTSRVIQNRKEQPEAYRLYLELMRRYALSFSLLEAGPHKEKITRSMDDALQLSDTYRVEKMDLGMAVVLFVVSAIIGLLDGALLDWGFLVASEGHLVKKEGSQSKDLDVKSRSSMHLEQLRRTNAFTALEVLENLCSSKCIQVSLHLVRSGTFEGLLQRLQLLEAQNLSSKSLPLINHLLERVFSYIRKASKSGYALKRQYLLGHMLDTGLVDSPLSHLISAGKASCWVTFDIFMENAMDGRTFCPASSFEMLTGLTKTLQMVNQASWQETFQALWISALRLVQRARDSVAGPIPHIEPRLSMLLSIVPLSITPLLKEESKAIISNGTGASSRKQSLVACLQSLAQFSSLLNPPQPAVTAANDAATKAATVVRGFNMASSNQMMPHIYSTKAVGNLLHLVVESCIARDLIDTSAYFWPGYVDLCGVTKDPNAMTTEDCPWLSFMQGAPLTRSLQSALIAVPAPSVTELKKLDHLALHGSEEERSAAPKILCGASLARGWNIQEYVVHMAVSLLSPKLSLGSPVTGDANPYLSHVHMLAALHACLSENYIINILSLYGVVPDIVAALLPLCEAFGSFPPPSTDQSCTAEEVSPYCIFSIAFLFLLKLCKFYGPDKGLHSSSFGGPLRPDLKLDFLILMHNTRLQSNGTAKNTYYENNDADPFHDLRCHSVYIDSFPKLRAWYFENQTCLVSCLSEKYNPSRTHLVANKILILICLNMNKNKWSVPSSTSITISTSSTSFSSSTSGSGGSDSFGSMSGDEYQGQPNYPAWDLLEAVPLVLDVIFTACSYGQISSRDLTIGLRDLVAFFPASIAAIICYFKGEIFRGTWKNVSLNGIDWPNPGEALTTFDLEVKEVLKHVGVHIENSHIQNVQPMLPLPLAAFLSLTITFKLNKKSEHLQRAIMGQAIENYAQVCPWPIMLTVGALWTQKAPWWRDFVVSLGAYSHFTNNKGAVDQLLHSCFKAFLGPTPIDGNCMTSTDGVVGLLGESVYNRHTVCPGILFLQSCHSFRSPRYFSEVICELVVECACQLADEWTLGGPMQMKSGRMSLAKAICVVRQVAMLGASLLCVAGRSALVQVLFEETVPTFLLSKHEDRSKQMFFNILQGYAISYLLFFSAAFVFGFQAETAPDKYRSSDMSPFVIASYLDFIAGVTDGNTVLRCDPAVWKAHVLGFVGLIVRFAPAWVPSTKLEALKKISTSLRGWHEYDLALSLLELGGISAVEAALELVL